MNVTKQQIIDVFIDLEKLKIKGIWYSGIKWKGEFKQWWRDGPLLLHCFHINRNKYRGKYKTWYKNGQLLLQCYFRGIKNKYSSNGIFYQGEDDKRFKSVYKEWFDNGKLKEYKIFNNDGSLKEKIV